MSVLRIEGLSRNFGSLIVTNQINLTVEEGERHVIIGPNGAGKTSLMNQIGGQLRPTSGHIFLRDRDLVGLAPEAVCRMGIARTFQRNNLFRELTVLENVRLAVQARRGGSHNFFTPASRLRPLIEAAEAALHLVHLSAVADTRVSRLSYGEQRQLEIAIALACEPELLLLDEPTSGMSPAETARMVDLIVGLPRRFAILLIEHDMQVVFSLADRLTVLYYGEIIASGSPEAVSADPHVCEVYLGAKTANRATTGGSDARG